MQQFSDINNVTGFFKEEASGKWMMKVKSLYDNIKILFGLNTLQIQVAEGEEIYKFIITTQDYKKIPLGWLIYYPSEKTLEVFESYLPDPILRFKGKQVVIENISPILSKAGASGLFKRLTNLL